jgi:hypothetical protein
MSHDSFSVSAEDSVVTEQELNNTAIKEKTN